MNASPPILEFRGIEKSFFGVQVLKAISFELHAGHTLGLVGENGAGKTTLMNLLGGNLAANAGEMRLNGLPYTPVSPRAAKRAGVAFIHQELNLFTNLTIAENIFIGDFPRVRPWLPWVNRRQMRERTRQLLAEVELDQSPDTRVERLAAGERQLVEIAKALRLDARLIILDEPTTSLTSRETDRLFGIMARLRARGLSMIYISHNLGHILRLCDDIVVLRDGQRVGAGPRTGFTLERMVSLMVGREITQFFPPRDSRPRTDVALEVRDLSQPGMIRDISFQLRHGEVLGLSGLMGSGRSELARILFGLDRCASGEIRLDGESVQELSPRQRIQRGLAFLTEDRHAEGLFAEASIADNLTSVALPQFAHTPLRWIDQQGVTTAVTRIRDAVKLTATARATQSVKTLSGGNQQKVVLGKWLLSQARVFILDEPTRGIDVGAKYEVYRLINDLAARGIAVLMISSEVEELIGMCDRILVMSRGAIRDAIEPHEFNRERILRAALHGSDLLHDTNQSEPGLTQRAEDKA
jgi:ribose transport system ATP-binding protein